MVECKRGITENRRGRDRQWCHDIIRLYYWSLWNLKSNIWSLLFHASISPILLSLSPSWFPPRAPQSSSASVLSSSSSSSRSSPVNRFSSTGTSSSSSSPPLSCPPPSAPERPLASAPPHAPFSCSPVDKELNHVLLQKIDMKIWKTQISLFPAHLNTIHMKAEEDHSKEAEISPRTSVCFCGLGLIPRRETVHGCYSDACVVNLLWNETRQVYILDICCIDLKWK